MYNTNTKKKFIKFFTSIGQKLLYSIIDVKTESGYKPIVGIGKTIQYTPYKIKTKNGLSLICADNHLLVGKNEVFYVKDSLGKKVLTKKGESEIISVELLNNKNKISMYDIQVYSDEHTYYTNGILSHNTTLVSLYTVWYIIFNSYKTVGIAANKASTAYKIIEDIKKIYLSVPYFMQQGVKKWAGSSIELQNNSKVKGEATTSNSLRGESINLLILDECLAGSSKIKIRNKNTGKIKEIKIEDFFNSSGGEVIN